MFCLGLVLPNSQHIKPRQPDVYDGEMPPTPKVEGERHMGFQNLWTLFCTDLCPPPDVEQAHSCHDEDERIQVGAAKHCDGNKDIS